MGQDTKIQWAHRFWAKVDRRGPNECWPWRAASLSSGYGVFHLDGENTTAHRAAYRVAIGDPGNLVIDHLCRNRTCCNPAHLEAVTNQENTRRGLRGSLPETCAVGHAWTQVNTGRAANGRRFCRACRRARDKRRQRPHGYWAAVHAKRKAVGCGN